MHGWTRGAASLVALGVWAGAAEAQVPDSVARLQGVTVSTSRVAAETGGASAVVVKVAELRASPAPLLEQALRESPFVLVRQNSRGEMELSVRGSDSRQAMVLLDGVPLSLGWDHRTDPSLIPVTGSENIVIVRGLGSLLNGPNTLGGTIDVSHAWNAASSRNGVWAGAGVDDNAGVVTTAGVTRRTEAGGGALLLQGGVAYRNRDGYALPEDAPDATPHDGLRTNSDLRHVDGFASLRWRNGAGRGIGLTVSAYDAERGVPPEEGISEPRLWRYPYHKRAIAALSGNTGTFATRFGRGSLDVGVGYNGGELKIDSYSDRSYSTVTATELGEETTMTARALLSHSLGSAVVRAGVTGADIRYDETIDTDPVAEYRQKMWSVGAEVDVPVGTRTSLAGGVVYDHTSTPETGGREPGQEPFDDIGWRAGLSHELSDAVRLHASASQRSRFPALREMYSGALNRFMPNPELKPETLLGFEGGVTMDRVIGASTQATFQATAFRHELDDAVVRITLPAPDRRFQRINRDQIESTGVELLAGFVFGDNTDRAVTLSGDALIQSVKLRDQTLAGQPERHAENNPEQRGSLELGVPIPLDLRLIGNTRYTGTQYCLNGDTDAEVEQEGVVESDLALERTFRFARGAFRTLRALVSMDNVTDQTVFDGCGLTQPGRTLRVMFTIR